MIAKARSISYGAAYTEYAAKKEKAVFLGAENMAGDHDLFIDDLQFEDLWLEFKEAGRYYQGRGKDVTLDMIKIECSPTSNESENWSEQEWFEHAKRLLAEIDKVELNKAKRDKKTGEWLLDEKGKRKKTKLPKTRLSDSRWAAILHRDSDSGIFHLHILVSRYTVDNQLNNITDIAKRAAMAAEKINQEMGWTKAMDIRQRHIDEINHVINDILASMEGYSFDWKEFEAKVRAATYTDYKGRTKNYTIQFHKDKYGNVDGYSIGREHSTFTASQLGLKLTNIPLYTKNSLKDIIYDTLRQMKGNTFDWDEFVAKLESKQCFVSLKHDSKGTVVNYSVDYAGKSYNASQIGSKLTAKKIISEWERIRKDDETKKMPVKQGATVVSSKSTAAEIERDKAESYGIIAIKDVISPRSFKREFSRRDIEDTLPEAIAAKAINSNSADGWREPGALDAAAQSLVDSVNMSAEKANFILAGVMSVVSEMVLPPDTPSIGGGGGGNNDLPKKRDDDWNWWKKNGFTKQKRTGLRR